MRGGHRKGSRLVPAHRRARADQTRSTGHGACPMAAEASPLEQDPPADVAPFGVLPPPEVLPTIVGVRNLAYRLGKTENTTRRMVKNGFVPHVRMGDKFVF